MAALINALDNYQSTKIGENGHVEYALSNSLQEQVLQFSFQLVRNANIEQLKNNYEHLLATLVHTFKYGSRFDREISRGLLSYLYKMIGHTRDIIDGKGEYLISYVMIYTWYQFYPELAQFALRCFVLNNFDNNTHPYGSWKDIKYFCEFCKRQDNSPNSPLIKYAIKLINEQIKTDYEALLTNKHISLAAKWTPREKSSFGWLYHLLAIDYFNGFIETATTDEQVKRAILKCKTEYRKLLSKLNKEIDTVQIKQCGHEWSNINFDKVTSITLMKQKKAFLNIKKTGEIKYPDNKDRLDCANNFSQHIQKAVRGEVEMKGKRVGMVDFTKQALELMLLKNNENECTLLNSQWRDNSSQNVALGKMIAMVDVSGSMFGDPMAAAIALGIRIAEKSLLGKRIMTFSSKPTWINLEPYTDFISQVKTISKADWGMNTNFYAALNLILDSIIQNKMAPEDVQDMVLVILSDMQMDQGDSCDKNALYESMKAKYEAAGIRVHGVPYKPPHILFWNLRSTSGFPCLANQPNASMMSGYSPSLLNLFCDQGLSALESCTPWSLLVKSLENERYKIMEDKFQEVLV